MLIYYFSDSLKRKKNTPSLILTLYNFMLGGDRYGLCLNKLYKEKQTEAQILAEIDVLLGRYIQEKQESETFGDYANRVILN